LRSLQPLALYPANSVFVAGYLTEPGQAYQETWQMIQDLGFEIEEHRAAAPEVCEAIAVSGS
jgi:biotin synthase